MYAKPKREILLLPQLCWLDKYIHALFALCSEPRDIYLANKFGLDTNFWFQFHQIYREREMFGASFS